MNAPQSDPDRNVAGLEPWFPWPLSQSSWWTTPLPAERLGALRIALSFCLLVDIAISYRPHLHDFYLQGGLGSPELFAWNANPPKLNWSLLRGLADPLLSALALVGLCLSGTWFLLALWSRWNGPPRPQPRSTAERGGPVTVWRSLLSLIVTGALLSLGAYARALPTEDQSCWPWKLLFSWQNDPLLLAVALYAWMLATFLLLIGWQTRLFAIAVFVLSMSFANINPSVDNAGDTVRGIILFYLMLSPCGSAWSLDSFLRRRRTQDRTMIVVHPWPLRLLFVQMCLIYFSNGIYKLLGPSWLAGESLYFVLRDITLTRISADQYRIPFVVTQVMTWSVVAWEVSFPLLVLWRWTRGPALALGVLFHLGIFASMELGGFAFYMWCLYVPLLPWEKIQGRR